MLTSVNGVTNSDVGEGARVVDVLVEAVVFTVVVWTVEMVVF